MMLKRNNESLLEAGSRSNSKTNNKGKEPIRGADIDSAANFGRGYSPASSGASSSYLSHDTKRPATADSTVNGRSKQKGSLLVAASDALGFRFGRRRPSIRQPPRPIIMPDVIEISASRRDEELEERNRLKQMAAEAIGLGPFMVSPDSQSRQSSMTTNEDDNDRNYTQRGTEVDRVGYGRGPGSTPNVVGRSPHGSSLSVSVPSQPPHGGRFRSGSMATYNPSGSKTIAPIPPFPTNVASLASFKQSVGLFPKYYPPSSLRIFALSKNWKNRYIILSTPATLVTRDQGPAVSYLHLFKSANNEDTELERLEINEDSVVFVSEEEVGGKRHVIKVGGADVGAMRKEYTHEEGGHTMWLLQIPDQSEAQTWITNIKNAILGQRTVRAGLIPASTLGNNEPRGDMDVMLSIRAQGLATSPTTTSARSSQALSSGTPPTADTKPNYASSISSQSVRSQANQKFSTSTGAVSALKGLFSSTTRPRSASRAASIESERQHDRDGADESFTSMGSNLLNLLRSNTPDSQSVVTVPSSPVARINLPFAGSAGPLDSRLDRKILADRQPIQWANSHSTALNKDRANKTFSIGALSLQPPPRKRWTSSTTAYSNSRVETQSIDRSRRTSTSTSARSTEKTETEPPSSPALLSGFQFGTPEQRPRASSLQSVSTLASNENGVSLDRSSLSTKRSSGTRSAKRWSRQGALPNRLTPPSEPPPAIPTNSNLSPSSINVVERAPSPNSSQSSQKSTVSSLPTFNKRASGSSMHSANSFSTSHSHTGTSPISNNPATIVIRPSSSHRLSVPPPRPAPTVALPPAPTDTNQDVLKPLETPASKSSFRNSVAHRTFRLSMSAAPKPPPSTNLPPRPDEPEFKNHRRSSSGSSANNLTLLSTKLETIPASPIPPVKLVNPFPPPAGPLPPTPVLIIPATSPQPSSPPKRATSITQRLRLRSSSSPSSTQQEPKVQPTHPLTLTSVAPRSLLTTTVSPPATPIAEKITMFQNDPSFLQMHTPVMPSMPLPQSFIPSPEEQNGVTSLSPPPRRGSKQLLETELESIKKVVEVQDDKQPTPVEGPPRHLSLSRPGSALSNYGHNNQGVVDADWENQRQEEIGPEILPEEKAPSLETRGVSLSRPRFIGDCQLIGDDDC
ncbi:hypothetical protein CPB84DRAFT_1724769 [Gymnopilus junonius]|uniref:PH domain-containing protein n=1 Tax=Gymnopilus junonius TaxID=109634 RepID=A0A9P5NWM3_GYMJU|nr:hypothetical protein CPB84DRAFT_1724769 [Gymnopilus junonius]